MLTLTSTMTQTIRRIRRIRRITLIGGASALMLCACSAPVASETPQETNAEVSAEVSAEAIPANSLTRVQFVRAMTCAEEKSEGNAKQTFAVQKSLYGDPAKESLFDLTMQNGGGDAYFAYTSAVALDCTGR